MKSIAKRLEQARIAAGYVDPDSAAKALGIPYPTYRGHENGTSGFRVESAVTYARRFKVSLDWLLTGKGKGPDSSEAWDLYVTMSELDPEDLEFLRQAIEYLLKKNAG